VALDPWSVGLGAAAWDVIKRLGGPIIKGLVKRKSDEAEAKRRLLRDAITECMKLTSVSAAAGIAYFVETERGSEARRTRGSEVRKNLRELATKFHQINLGFEHNGQGHFDQSLLISFRQAVTMRLDDANLDRLSDDDPIVTAIYRSSHHLQIELTKRLYAST